MFHYNSIQAGLTYVDERSLIAFPVQSILNQEKLTLQDVSIGRWTTKNSNCLKYF